MGNIMKGMSISFVLTGLLIGSLVALSATSLAGVLVSLLFTFLGGSVIALFSKMTGEALHQATLAIGCLSGGALAGLFLCLFLTEYRLLTPHRFENLPIEQKKVLRSAQADAVRFVINQYRNRTLTCEAALAELEEKMP
jgi:hypothetical protein